MKYKLKYLEYYHTESLTPNRVLLSINADEDAYIKSLPGKINHYFVDTIECDSKLLL